MTIAFAIRVCVLVWFACLCVYSSVTPPSLQWFEPKSVCDFAMSRSRVFENHEFEAAAAKATKNAKEDVMKRFYIPIVGTLRCMYMGTQKPEEKDLIVFNTKVVFKWPLKSPHVKGSVEQAFRCCRRSCLFVLFLLSGSPRVLHASSGT